MVEVERFHEFGRSLNERLVQTAGSNCNSAGPDTRAIEHVAQADASPPGISHGPILPLSAGHPRLEQTAGIARALTDRHELDPRHRQQICERQRKRLVDVTANDKLELGHVHVFRDYRPMPAHEELVVRGEDAAIEHLERRFEQRRTRALQNHPSLLWEGRRQLAPIRAAWQIEVDEAIGPSGPCRCHPAEDACALKETTTTWGANEVPGDPHGNTRAWSICLTMISRLFRHSPDSAASG